MLAIKNAVYLFHVEKNSRVWLMVSSMLLHNTEELPTLTVLLWYEDKVINRGGKRKESLFNKPYIPWLMDHAMLQRAKEEEMETTEWDKEQDVASLVCFWLIMHFFS